jgi:ribosomal protein S18 acetylase RimI-like enzyme
MASLFRRTPGKVHFARTTAVTRVLLLGGIGRYPPTGRVNRESLMVGTRDGAVESAQQLLGMWKALIEDRGAAATSEAGVAHRWADTAFGFYNTLSFADAGVDGTELRARLDHAVTVMRASERTGFLWVFEELLTDAARADLDRVADEAGLARAMTCYGMAGDILPLPAPHHPDLRFERASTQAHLDAYASLNARAYAMSEADVRAAFAGSTLWREDIHAYIGFEGDRPVCCAGTYPVDGRLFVVLVATDPDRQRRGFGEAVTRKALHEGAKATGLTRATLQATDAGRPVYERIGLRLTSNVPLYGLA